ncbi:MAG: SAM-dependent methyltransferase [Saprospiraceae bacterium]
MAIGKLYLIPCFIHEENPFVLLPDYLKSLATLRLFIVENIRTARRFIKTVIPEFDINACTFWEIDKHAPNQSFSELWALVMQGQDLGLLAEAGSPCIADPGSSIVSEAHRRGIPVKPWIGPTSIALALMASGLNGQGFTFHGYLPSRSKEELSKKIKTLDQQAWSSGYTQICIETPYRNQQLFPALLNNLREDTILAIAVDLSAPSELIISKSIRSWKQSNLEDIQKRPAIFLFNRPALN